MTVKDFFISQKQKLSTHCSQYTKFVTYNIIHKYLTMDIEIFRQIS
jgi:hypothetical protein